MVEVQDGESAGAESEGPGALIGPNGPTVITRKLTAIDVAITGIVLGRNTARALVFNNAEEEGKWIDVPGEAYGYQVEYVTMKGAVVSKDGRTYVLLLGANRKDTQDYSVPGAGGGEAPQTPPPGQTPGPDAVSFRDPRNGARRAWAHHKGSRLPSESRDDLAGAFLPPA